jgi:type VI protein secretion system component VasF
MNRDPISTEYIVLLDAWSANRDPEGVYGYGATRQAAIDDLIDREADAEDVHLRYSDRWSKINERRNRKIDRALFWISVGALCATMFGLYMGWLS